MANDTSQPTLRYVPAKSVSWDDAEPGVKRAIYRLMRLEIRDQFTGGEVLQHCFLDGQWRKTEFYPSDAEDWLVRYVDRLWERPKRPSRCPIYGDRCPPPASEGTCCEEWMDNVSVEALRNGR